MEAPERVHRARQRPPLRTMTPSDQDQPADAPGAVREVGAVPSADGRLPRVARRPARTRMGLLEGKKALIFGVANDHSIAWGIAQALHAEGAEVGF